MAKASKAKQSDKPNILVIWGDDIGISNLSCYSHGLMGYQTPNIDRIANEGFTDLVTTDVYRKNDNNDEVTQEPVRFHNV